MNADEQLGIGRATQAAFSGDSDAKEMMEPMTVRASSRSRGFRTLAAGALVAVLAACGGSSGGATSSTTPVSAPSGTSTPAEAGNATASTPGNAVDPNGPEVVEPGDIPDNQAFVTFPSPNAPFSVDVPEGWARTEQDGTITFTDKFNAIRIDSMSADVAPTVDSVTADGLSDVSSDPTFALVSVEPVTRTAGDGIVAKYEIGSAPNDVTGKQALLAVERYVFVHNGTEVVLTLSGAKGADNVDPWKIVSDSLAWT